MKFSESTLKLAPNYDKLPSEAPEYGFSKTKLGIMYYVQNEMWMVYDRYK